MRFRKRSSRPESSVEEQVDPLNEAEQEWVATNVAEATRMLDGELSAERLDDLWATLLNEEPADPNPAINMVGLAFGQLLADRLGLSWVALTDEHGTEIAVRGRANFTVFPTNFVAKRYEQRETNFHRFRLRRDGADRRVARLSSGRVTTSSLTAGHRRERVGSSAR